MGTDEGIVLAAGAPSRFHRTVNVPRDRSRDIAGRVESLLECARMMRTDHCDEDSVKVLEPAHRSEQERTNQGINFLKAEDSEPTGSLNRIIEEVRSQEAPRGHRRRLDVKVDLDPAVSSVGLDVATVGRALANLVSEAIDQSSEGAFVRIETRLADGGTTLLLIRNHDFPIRTDQTRCKPNGAAVKVAQDSTEIRLVVVLSMTVGNGGTVSCMSPPDGLGEVVSYGFQRDP